MSVVSCLEDKTCGDARPNILAAGGLFLVKGKSVPSRETAALGSFAPQKSPQGPLQGPTDSACGKSRTNDGGWGTRKNMKID